MADTNPTFLIVSFGVVFCAGLLLAQTLTTSTIIVFVLTGAVTIYYITQRAAQNRTNTNRPSREKSPTTSSEGHTSKRRTQRKQDEQPQTTSKEDARQPTVHEQEEDKFIRGAYRQKKYEGPRTQLKFAKQIAELIKPVRESISFDDVIGCGEVKERLELDLIDPAINPAAFGSALGAAKGLLLFGPPGNGKTRLVRGRYRVFLLTRQMKALTCELDKLAKDGVIAKPIETIHVSARDLTARLLGEGEKAAAALFEVARLLQPTVIIIDEVESLMSSRDQSNQHEAMGRLKNEILAGWDGFLSNESDQIYVIASTNYPWQLDDAMKRRFKTKLFIGVPKRTERSKLVEGLLTKCVNNGLSIRCCECERCNIFKAADTIASHTERFSFDDLAKLVQEVEEIPVRRWKQSRPDYKSRRNINTDELEPVTKDDLVAVCRARKPTSDQDAIDKYQEFITKPAPCKSPTKSTTNIQLPPMSRNDWHNIFRSGNVDRLRQLCAVKPEQLCDEFPFFDHDTNLYFAFECDNEQMIRLVLDTFVQRHGASATFYAAANALAQLYSDVVPSIDSLQQPAKHPVNGSFHFLCDLVCRGADVNWQESKFGRTALYDCGVPALVTYLLQHGSDPTVRRWETDDLSLLELMEGLVCHLEELLERTDDSNERKTLFEWNLHGAKQSKQLIEKHLKKASKKQ